MAITIILLALLILVLVLIFFNSKQQKHQQAVLGGVSLVDPPSPVSLPIIGHLHLLGGYEVPYQAFTALGKKYGDVLKLRLGSVPSVVVNGKDNIKEVLVSKGHHFDSRPSFERYQQLFGGDKQNCK